MIDFDCMRYLVLAIYIICHFPTVPAPSVNITGVLPSTIYAGTSLLLTCTFELHSAVDSPIALGTVWRRGGLVLSSDSRVNIASVGMATPTTYRTTLSISPVSNTVDSGQYSCQSVFPSDPYVLFTDASQQVPLRIEGEYAVPVLAK